MFKKTILLLLGTLVAVSCLKKVSNYDKQQFIDTANAQGIELYMRTHRVVNTQYGPELQEAKDGDPDNLWETRRTEAVTKDTPYDELLGRAFQDTTKIKVVIPSGDTVERASGIWMFIHSRGHSADRPQDSSAVLVKYTGYLLNDKSFAIAPTGSTLYLTSGSIVGFSVGMKYFEPGYLDLVTVTPEPNEDGTQDPDYIKQTWTGGGKGFIIMPSKYGYGDELSASIPPNSVLIFNINLLSIANYIKDDATSNTLSISKNTEITKWQNIATKK
ncbi:MAG: FKBP-type peptidyl-prolyl cis-trans isomerase [Flavobacteriales bacterium]|nr:FKBP-type peptidyl-prolyl cis-trans isomerase [Flavobacteriales bacterium]